MNLFRHPTLCALLLTLLPLPLRATGDYWTGPTYLEGSGDELKSAPEFFWHEEIVRLAAKYRDKDSTGMKALRPPHSFGFLSFEHDVDDPSGESPDKDERPVTAADLADFADALKTGRLKPADAEGAKTTHALARAAIDTNQPLPAGEADSEFADYHAGAAVAKTTAAVTAWQKLLARPKEERHYRSVWAAFMLGKNALAAEKWDDAVKYFRQCRALTREGFADSLALAADSYGWEARAELMADHYPQAARLYLTQLALGDFSAVVSLKHCIPDLVLPDSGESPDPAPDRTAAETEANDDRWEEAARDPALQELVTAHILATDTAQWVDDFSRSKHWLEVLTKARITKAADAVRLAWLAYNCGDYKVARGWLAKADSPTPLGRWLEAKFAMREGKFEAAGKIMPEVIQGFPPPEPDFESIAPPHDRAHGESAALLYAKGQFVEAFDRFVIGHCDDDVMFMIESVLTTDELRTIATKIPAVDFSEETTPENEKAPPGLVGKDWRAQASEIRSQIGRRMVREGKVKDARPLLGKEACETMDQYIALTLKAEKKTIPAEARARAWWDAAVLMFDLGHTFRGTEQDFHRPTDGEGDYTVRRQRVAGRYTPPDPPAGDPDAKAPDKPVPVFIPTSKSEQKRLAATARHYEKAMRTRVVAAGHLLKAADLLADGTEDKAEVLNTAGYWLQDIDNPAADRIYNRIEKGFADTPTGKAVMDRHWFTGTTNPWEGIEPEKVEEGKEPP